MRIQGIWCLMPLLVLGLASLPAHVEEVAFADLLSGRVAPLTVTVQEMKTGWMQFEAGNTQTTPMDFFLGMARAEAELSSMPSIYYTQGRTVTCQGQSFLVAYQYPVDLGNLMGKVSRKLHMPGAPSAEAPQVITEVTLTSAFSLSLLNLNSLGSLADFTPVDIEKLLTTPANPVEAPVTGIGEARLRAQQTQSTSNLRQLALAVNLYCQENEEMFPTIIGQQDIKTQIAGVAEQILVSPLSGMPYKYNYALSGKALGQVANPSETIMFYDEPDVRGNRIAAFVDGHVQTISAATWKELIAKTPFE